MIKSLSVMKPSIPISFSPSTVPQKILVSLKSATCAYKSPPPTRCAAPARSLRSKAAWSSSAPCGEVHVVVGPMFAGKTTTLLRRMQSETDSGSFQVGDSVNLGRTLKRLCITGKMSEAVGLLWRAGVHVGHGTYTLLLQECIFGKMYSFGRRIHAQMVVAGHAPNEYLQNKLLILYAKAGDLATACVLFDRLPEKSLVSWNALIAGHVQNGVEDAGLSLYDEMRRKGVVPDQYTFSSVFRACASLAVLEHGKNAHGVFMKLCLRENVVVSSALMDMYFKCCDLDAGRRVFDEAVCKNVVTWTSLIYGYGLHGRAGQVFESFRRMKDEGLRPNDVTFLAVISACSHVGLVAEGRKYFLSMERDYGIKPRAQHYAAVVDLLGRSGRVQEAFEFALNSPCKEHSVVWGSLLGACRIYGNMDLLKLATKRYFELDAVNAGTQVVVSNILATFGLWENVAEVREWMKDSGIKKEPACSWIQIQGENYIFLTGDKTHKQSDQIYRTVIEMSRHMMDVSLLTGNMFG